MSNGTLHLTSQNLSVVDDVDVVPKGNTGLDEDDQNPEVTDLGDGYVEINGYVFYENWDEIDPPGSEGEPEIPHEVVTAEFEAMLKQRLRRGWSVFRDA
jgi:hypothetical protein